MMVDSSALLAIVFQEPGFEELVQRLLEAQSVAAGAPTLAETGIVLHARLGEGSYGLLERMLDEFGVQVVPFGEVHWREAVDAYRRFGRGRHPASLNFGDCLTYAAAKLTGEPLLFVGGDFLETDLEAAPPTETSPD
jgi:ribonuclease VapC